MSPEHRAILERMRSSAGVVQRVVEAAPPGRLGQAPREAEWSALETLTHMRDVIVHVYGLRIRRLLYEDAPVFGDFDEEGYRRASLARGEVVADLLDTLLAAKSIAYPDADLGHASGIHFRAVRDRLGTWAAGMPTAATSVDGGRALIQFLSSPPAGAIIKKTGMEPVAR